MRKTTLRSSLIAVSSALTFAATSVSAQEATTVENAFSQCGIGAAIFTKNETAAIISNVIWDLGTTAFSSQTSSPESCTGAKVSAAAFINETYPVLEEQFVKGGGTHVAALMNIMQCEVSQQSLVVANVQQELGQSFAEESFLASSQTQKAAHLGGIVDRAMASCNA